MNKFNNRVANNTRERRKKSQGIKKQKGTLKKYKAEQAVRSGARTGKSAKKREKRAKLQVNTCYL